MTPVEREVLRSRLDSNDLYHAIDLVCSSAQRQAAPGLQVDRERTVLELITEKPNAFFEALHQELNQLAVKAADDESERLVDLACRVKEVHINNKQTVQTAAQAVPPNRTYSTQTNQDDGHSTMVVETTSAGKNNNAERVGLPLNVATTSFAQETDITAGAVLEGISKSLRSLAEDVKNFMTPDEREWLRSWLDSNDMQQAVDHICSSVQRQAALYLQTNGGRMEQELLETPDALVGALCQKLSRLADNANDDESERLVDLAFRLKKVVNSSTDRCQGHAAVQAVPSNQSYSTQTEQSSEPSKTVEATIRAKGKNGAAAEAELPLIVVATSFVQHAAGTESAPQAALDDISKRLRSVLNDVHSFMMPDEREWLKSWLDSNDLPQAVDVMCSSVQRQAAVHLQTNQELVARNLSKEEPDALVEALCQELSHLADTANDEESVRLVDLAGRLKEAVGSTQKGSASHAATQAVPILRSLSTQTMKDTKDVSETTEGKNHERLRAATEVFIQCADDVDTLPKAAVDDVFKMLRSLADDVPSFMTPDERDWLKSWLVSNDLQQAVGVVCTSAQRQAAKDLQDTKKRKVQELPKESPDDLVEVVCQELSRLADIANDEESERLVDLVSRLKEAVNASNKLTVGRYDEASQTPSVELSFSTLSSSKDEAKISILKPSAQQKIPEQIEGPAKRVVSTSSTTQTDETIQAAQRLPSLSILTDASPEATTEQPRAALNLLQSNSIQYAEDATTEQAAILDELNNTIRTVAEDVHSFMKPDEREWLKSWLDSNDLRQAVDLVCSSAQRQATANLELSQELTVRKLSDGKPDALVEALCQELSQLADSASDEDSVRLVDLARRLNEVVNASSNKQMLCNEASQTLPVELSFSTLSSSKDEAEVSILKPSAQTKDDGEKAKRHAQGLVDTSCNTQTILRSDETTQTQPVSFLTEASSDAASKVAQAGGTTLIATAKAESLPLTSSQNSFVRHTEKADVSQTATLHEISDTVRAFANDVDSFMTLDEREWVMSWLDSSDLRQAIDVVCSSAQRHAKVNLQGVQHLMARELRQDKPDALVAALIQELSSLADTASDEESVRLADLACRLKEAANANTCKSHEVSHADVATQASLATREDAGATATRLVDVAAQTLSIDETPGQKELHGRSTEVQPVALTSTTHSFQLAPDADAVQGASLGQRREEIMHKKQLVQAHLTTESSVHYAEKDDESRSTLDELKKTIRALADDVHSFMTPDEREWLKSWLDSNDLSQAFDLVCSSAQRQATVALQGCQGRSSEQLSKEKPEALVGALCQELSQRADKSSDEESVRLIDLASRLKEAVSGLDAGETGAAPDITRLQETVDTLSAEVDSLRESNALLAKANASLTSGLDAAQSDAEEAKRALRQELAFFGRDTVLHDKDLLRHVKEAADLLHSTRSAYEMKGHKPDVEHVESPTVNEATRTAALPLNEVRLSVTSAPAAEIDGKTAIQQLNAALVLATSESDRLKIALQVEERATEVLEKAAVQGAARLKELTGLEGKQKTVILEVVQSLSKATHEVTQQGAAFKEASDALSTFSQRGKEIGLSRNSSFDRRSSFGSNAGSSTALAHQSSRQRQDTYALSISTNSEPDEANEESSVLPIKSIDHALRSLIFTEILSLPSHVLRPGLLEADTLSQTKFLIESLKSGNRPVQSSCEKPETTSVDTEGAAPSAHSAPEPSKLHVFLLGKLQDSGMLTEIELAGSATEKGMARQLVKVLQQWVGAVNEARDLREEKGFWAAQHAEQAETVDKLHEEAAEHIARNSEEADLYVSILADLQTTISLLGKPASDASSADHPLPTAEDIGTAAKQLPILATHVRSEVNELRERTADVARTVDLLCARHSAACTQTEMGQEFNIVDRLTALSEAWSLQQTGHGSSALAQVESLAVDFGVLVPHVEESERLDVLLMALRTSISEKDECIQRTTNALRAAIDTAPASVKNRVAPAATTDSQLRAFAEGMAQLQDERESLVIKELESFAEILAVPIAGAPEGASRMQSVLESLRRATVDATQRENSLLAAKNDLDDSLAAWQSRVADLQEQQNLASAIILRSTEDYCGPGTDTTTRTLHALAGEDVQLQDLVESLIGLQEHRETHFLGELRDSVRALGIPVDGVPPPSNKASRGEALQNLLNSLRSASSDASGREAALRVAKEQFEASLADEQVKFEVLRAESLRMAEVVREAIELHAPPSVKAKLGSLSSLAEQVAVLIEGLVAMHHENGDDLQAKTLLINRFEAILRETRPATRSPADENAVAQLQAILERQTDLSAELAAKTVQLAGIAQIVHETDAPQTPESAGTVAEYISKFIKGTQRKSSEAVEAVYKRVQDVVLEGIDRLGVEWEDAREESDVSTEDGATAMDQKLARMLQKLRSATVEAVVREGELQATHAELREAYDAKEAKCAELQRSLSSLRSATATAHQQELSLREAVAQGNNALGAKEAECDKTKAEAQATAASLRALCDACGFERTDPAPGGWLKALEDGLAAWESDLASLREIAVDGNSTGKPTESDRVSTMLQSLKGAIATASERERELRTANEAVEVSLSVKTSVYHQLKADTVRFARSLQRIVADCGLVCSCDDPDDDIAALFEPPLELLAQLAGWIDTLSLELSTAGTDFRGISFTGTHPVPVAVACLKEYAAWMQQLSWDKEAALDDLAVRRREVDAWRDTVQEYLSTEASSVRGGAEAGPVAISEVSKAFSEQKQRFDDLEAELAASKGVLLHGSAALRGLSTPTVVDPPRSTTDAISTNDLCASFRSVVQDAIASSNARKRRLGDLEAELATARAAIRYGVAAIRDSLLRQENVVVVADETDAEAALLKSLVQAAVASEKTRKQALTELAELSVAPRSESDPSALQAHDLTEAEAIQVIRVKLHEASKYVRMVDQLLEGTARVKENVVSEKKNMGVDEKMEVLVEHRVSREREVQELESSKRNFDEVSSRVDAELCARYGEDSEPPSGDEPTERFQQLLQSLKIEAHDSANKEVLLRIVNDDLTNAIHHRDAQLHDCCQTVLAVAKKIPPADLSPSVTETLSGLTQRYEGSANIVGLLKDALLAALADLSSAAVARRSLESSVRMQCDGIEGWNLAFLTPLRNLPQGSDLLSSTSAMAQCLGKARKEVTMRELDLNETQRRCRETERLLKEKTLRISQLQGTMKECAERILKMTDQTIAGEPDMTESVILLERAHRRKQKALDDARDRESHCLRRIRDLNMSYHADSSERAPDEDMQAQLDLLDESFTLAGEGALSPLYAQNTQLLALLEAPSFSTSVPPDASREAVTQTEDDEGRFSLGKGAISNVEHKLYESLMGKYNEAKASLKEKEDELVEVERAFEEAEELVVRSVAQAQEQVLVLEAQNSAFADELKKLGHSGTVHVVLSGKDGVRKVEKLQANVEALVQENQDLRNRRDSQVEDTNLSQDLQLASQFFQQKRRLTMRRRGADVCNESFASSTSLDNLLARSPLTPNLHLPPLPSSSAPTNREPVAVATQTAKLETDEELVYEAVAEAVDHLTHAKQKSHFMLGLVQSDLQIEMSFIDEGVAAAIAALSFTRPVETAISEAVTSHAPLAWKKRFGRIAKFIAVYDNNYRTSTSFTAGTE
ncbi:hypothetical protein DIPPA_04430 [Diplonema papillatum]|nr:hypothetical protein DIPPA_04430 [Diplonema papillatum]